MHLFGKVESVKIYRMHVITQKCIKCSKYNSLCKIMSDFISLLVFLEI